MGLFAEGSCDVLAGDGGWEGRVRGAVGADWCLQGGALFSRRCRYLRAAATTLSPLSRPDAYIEMDFPRTQFSCVSKKSVTDSALRKS